MSLLDKCNEHFYAALANQELTLSSAYFVGSYMLTFNDATVSLEWHIQESFIVRVSVFISLKFVFL